MRKIEMMRTITDMMITIHRMQEDECNGKINKELEKAWQSLHKAWKEAYSEVKQS